MIPLTENIFPSSEQTINSIISHLDANNQVGVVVGKFEGRDSVPALPTLLRVGVSAFRKAALEKAGGLSTLHGDAADYDLSLRILAAGSRIDHREDLVFQSRTDSAQGNLSIKESTLSIREMTDRLAIIRRHLPENLANIYWQDWATKYKALATNGHGKLSGHLAILLAKLQSIRLAISAPDPVSLDVFESIFTLRRHAAAIGDWARRGSVWRVVLADFSDNLWASYNACRATGLQMRCVADNHPAYANRSYRDLPIVPASRAFEGGGIDGVILTSTDPSEVETSFKSLRNYFHGPILRLCQSPRVATHVQAAAA